jgi:hypothetical protein
MKFRLIAALIIFVIPGLSYISADIYRWTDGKGRVTYGNQPPADAQDLKLMINEQASSPDAGAAAGENSSSDVETITQEPKPEKNIMEEGQRTDTPAPRQATPSRQEEIDQEKVKLETKIAELEAQPLDYFGSQKNKRARIGYYKNRLDTLMTNPDDYFTNPAPFEGNIKIPNKKQ